MANIFLDRVDAAPISNSEFPFEFNQWLANTVDSLNEVINDIQNALTFLTSPNYTAAQISAFFTGGMLSNGVILYDTTNNEYVGMISGALVKFTTTAYP
jgi:hypothetical protein